MLKKIGFGNQCLIALILGLIVGHFVSQDIVNFITPFGDAFLRLLKLVVVPLTFSTIIASFSKLESVALIKKIGLNTLVWFVITALIAASLGVVVGLIINPGIGINLLDSYTNYQPRQIPSISTTFLDMLPSNLIGQIADGKVIPVIIFAIFFGVALTVNKDKATTLKAFFSEFSDVMFMITRKIIRLSPIGIFALLVQVGNHYGIDTIIPLVKFILAVYIACILQLFIYGLLVMFTTKQNPLLFYKKSLPAMITAFTTSSSLGTLPVTIDTLINRLDIKPSVAGFVAPLGATMKMDGCGAIYPALVCILTANILHIDLTMQQYLLMIITATIATIGTAGVPGTASIMATVVLASVGLPLEGLALVIGIDKIVDMIRTMTNVTGSVAVSVIVNHKYEYKE